MVASQVLLQKPYNSSKARDHVAALGRRLDAWQAGDLEGLLREGRTIQDHLSMRRMKNEQGDRVALVFSRLMLEGKTRAALRYLSENEHQGLLSLDESYGSGTVRDALQEKHRRLDQFSRKCFYLLTMLTHQMFTPYYLNESQEMPFVRLHYELKDRQVHQG